MSSQNDALECEQLSPARRMSSIHFLAGRGVMVMAAPEQAQTPMVAEASVQPLSVDMPLSPGGLCNHGQFLHRGGHA